MRRRILVALLLVVQSVAFAQHREDEPIALRDHVIEYNSKPIIISLSYPQLEVKADNLDESIMTLLRNINRDACQQVALATLGEGDDDSNIEKLASTPAMLELYALSAANNSLSEQAEYIPQEAWSYGLYSEWEAYANDYIVTISQTVYNYKGGYAHGTTATTLNNYVKKSGKSFSFGDIIDQKENFMRMVVKYFCRERMLSVKAPMAKTGLFMELADLPFPEEIGLGLAGLKVIYQPYDIAPYAAGVIDITIPYKALEDILPEEFFDIVSAKGGKTINVKVTSKN